jgi:CubicO group peptidase (beta-lactamase class C family)
VEAQDDVAAMMAKIEAAQVPNRGGFDGLTLKQLMDAVGTPGVSIAVIKDFKIHWAKGYGVADAESGTPVDPTTVFQAASMSKPVAAMAAVRLVQEGRFSLDDDVNSLLKSWQVPKSAYTRDQPVTPRSLFSHSSGADDGFGFPGYEPSTPIPTVVQILNGAKPANRGAVLFARPPYQAFKYSGGGLTIMQLAMTDLTGTPFVEIMRKNVLEPLAMTNSSYQQPMSDAFAAHAAKAHSGGGKRVSAPWNIYPELAAAGLWTTPSDLARFVIEVQTAYRGPKGRVLSQASAREMIAPIGVGPFAVGLTIEKRGDGWYFSNGGSNRGFRGEFMGHVRNGYGVVVMTNSDNGGIVVNEIRTRVAAAYGWDALDKPLIR